MGNRVEGVVLRFGIYELDPRSGELRKAGMLVKLQPQPGRVLTLLASRAGQLITHEEIRQEIWGEGTFVDFEKGLAFCIKQIRNALGDDAHNPRYIETLQRRGYRFLAPVEGIPQASAEVRVRVESSEARRGRGLEPRARLAWLGVGVAIAVAVLAFILGGPRLLEKDRLKGKVAARFEGARVTKLTGSGRSILAAISPDGKYFAHVEDETGAQSLWITQIGIANAVRLVGPASLRYRGLTFSPDSNWIYYVRDSILHRVPVLGGTPQTLLQDVDWDISFSPGGKDIVFVREDLSRSESTLRIAGADGSRERVLRSLKLPWYYRSASWSPDGKTIACTVMNRAGSPQALLRQVSVETGDEKPIPARSWLNAGPLAWLADGSGLALLARSDNLSPAQIWRVSYPTGEAVKISQDPGDYRGSLSLRADSRALVTVRQSLLSDIWVSAAAGSSLNLQVTSGRGQDLHPSWTPSRAIVYQSYASGNWDIWMMSADGGSRKRLTGNSCQETSPAVSPDGRHIVYISDCPGVPSLWRMDLDGNNSRQLTAGGPVRSVCPSPDGKWVFYESLQERPTIWRISMEGGEPMRWTEKLSRQPVVSPDGRLLAFYHWDERPDSPRQIAVLSLPAGKLVKTFDLPPGASHLTPFRWSPDGRGLTFALERQGASNIWMQPFTGGALRQLTFFPGHRIISFDWSPDGKALASARGFQMSEVVMISDSNP